MLQSRSETRWVRAVDGGSQKEEVCKMNGASSISERDHLSLKSSRKEVVSLAGLVDERKKKAES